MNTGTLVNFLGWASLTYIWLKTHHLLFDAIIDAINEHDEQIKQKMIEEVKECIRRKELEENDESEDESEDENEDE